MARRGGNIVPHARGGWHVCIRIAEWILCRFFFPRHIDITAVDVMRMAGRIGGTRPSCHRRGVGCASRSAEKRFSARCNPNARASRSLTTARHPKLICIISACRLQRNAWLRLRGENVRLKRDIRRWCERNGMEMRRDTLRSRAGASHPASWTVTSGQLSAAIAEHHWSPSRSELKSYFFLSAVNNLKIIVPQRHSARSRSRRTSRRVCLILFRSNPDDADGQRIMLPEWQMNWNCFLRCIYRRVVVVCCVAKNIPPAAMPERHLHNILI